MKITLGMVLACGLAAGGALADIQRSHLSYTLRLSPPTGTYVDAVNAAANVYELQTSTRTDLSTNDTDWCQFAASASDSGVGLAGVAQSLGGSYPCSDLPASQQGVVINSYYDYYANPCTATSQTLFNGSAACSFGICEASGIRTTILASAAGGSSIAEWDSGTASGWALCLDVGLMVESVCGESISGVTTNPVAVVVKFFGGSSLLGQETVTGSVNSEGTVTSSDLTWVSGTTYAYQQTFSVPAGTTRMTLEASLGEFTAFDIDQDGDADCDDLASSTLRDALVDYGSYPYSANGGTWDDGYHPTIDLNHDGVVTEEEGRACLRAINPVDFNQDGFIDFFDYDDYVNCFNNDICPPYQTPEFNGDNFVDYNDYNDFVYALDYGPSCSW